MGVVGDLRRDMEGHHYAEKCSVFGLSQEELEVIQRLVSPHFWQESDAWFVVFVAGVWCLINNPVPDVVW